MVTALILMSAIALVADTGLAQTRAPDPSPGTMQDLAGLRLDQMLRPDGSPDLSSDRRASMSAAGWRMTLDESGAPRFLPDSRDAGGRPTRSPGASATILDPSDVNWDDRFVLPNGVDNNGTDFTVGALAVDGTGNVYVGGFFSMAGEVSAYGVAKWDGANWSALGSGIDGMVNALAADGAGNLYAGSEKWDGTSWSVLGSGPDAESLVGVQALAVDGAGNLYVGGSFETADGDIVANVAKWDGAAWSTLGSGFEPANAVRSLAVDGAGNLYVGGLFWTAGGVSAHNVAKWDGTRWSALGSGLTGWVDALAVDAGGNLYAGGSFSRAGDVTAYNVAKWNGTTWSALGSGTNYRVYSLAVDRTGNLYAGGYFTTAGGVGANRVAKWNGTNWSALGSGVNELVRALALDGAGNLYAGGEFWAAGGIGANHVAKWDGSTWSALGSGAGLGADSPIHALVSDGAGHVYAAGYLLGTAGRAVVNRVARWDGADWSVLGAGMGGDFWLDVGVGALAVDGAGDLYAGGSFQTAGSVSAKNVAKWDGARWSALGSGMKAVVWALAADGAGNLYAASVPGGPSVAKWDGTSWSALGSGMDAVVRALAVDGAGTLCAGGDFMAAGGVSVNFVAKWDGTKWSALSSGMNGGVCALALDRAGNLYAGGLFTTAGGVSANHVAMWDGTSWSALGPGVPGAVYAMAVDRAGNLYTGASAAEVSVGAGSKWDGTNWSPLGSGMNSFVDALAVDEVGNVFAGGGFTSAGGKVSSHIALWRERHIITATAGAGGSIAPSGAVTVINGDDRLFAVTPDAGYHVADVLVDGSSVGAVTSYTFPKVTADHSIAAIFAAQTHPLSVTVVGSGTVTRSPDLPQYLHGSTVVLSAAPAPDRQFAGWSDDASGTEPNVSIVMDRDKSVTATFGLGATFVLEPRELNLKSEGRWVTGTIRLPAPYRASQIDIASIRLNGVVRTAPECPGKIEEHDTRLTAKFSRAEVQRTLKPGEQVPVSVSGMAGGEWFMGTDHITVRAPGMDRTAASERLADGQRLTFSLRPLNPALGPLVVSFSLASDAPAALAVYDVSGRLVVRRDLGSLGPGSHSLRLGDLPTGVYVVRLTQGDRSLTSRAVVIR
jgi:hypothetical protein